ncbi:ribose-phosphate pyrophosphokinase [Candidatus Peregrinibacteria bacterium]|nr:ribose-phosphate pyrophosphokinase [Candidatus Peregrinibacteria bacterium]
MSSIKIFSGTSHPELAKAIAKNLKMKLSEIVISRFACGEIYSRSLESVRGCDVFIIQTATHKVNEDLMELFIMIDALKRAFASKIHIVMPYYGYARQDRVTIPREPISAKLVADLIAAAGADHVITIALHSDQLQGFFNFPVDNLTARKLFVEYFNKKKIKNCTVVSPDAGGVKEAKRFANLIGVQLAVIYKSRPSHNVSEITTVVGDVEGRTCLLYDDMIDTAGSVCNAREALLKAGANKEIYLAATHPVFSDPAIQRLRKAKFKEIVVTDSIPIPKNKLLANMKILSVAHLLADVIEHVHKAKSVTEVL